MGEVDMTGGGSYDVKSVIQQCEDLKLGPLLGIALDDLNTGSPMYIDAIKHQAKLVVSKHGIKFAAATSMEIRSRGRKRHVPEPVVPIIKIDGPYIMSIVVRDSHGEEHPRLIATAFQGTDKPNPGEDW